MKTGWSHRSIQFSIFRPSIRLKWSVLPVTRMSSSSSAVAAINICYQTSTLRTISEPWRSSAANSSGSFSPPQLPLMFSRNASRLAPSSSSHVERDAMNSSQDFLASSSSCSTLSRSWSTNQRRSCRLMLFSMVSKASMGIVVVTAFIMA